MMPALPSVVARYDNLRCHSDDKHHGNIWVSVITFTDDLQPHGIRSSPSALSILT